MGSGPSKPVENAKTRLNQATGAASQLANRAVAESNSTVGLSKKTWQNIGQRCKQDIVNAQRVLEQAIAERKVVEDQMRKEGVSMNGKINNANRKNNKNKTRNNKNNFS